MDSLQKVYDLLREADEVMTAYNRDVTCEVCENVRKEGDGFKLLVDKESSQSRKLGYDIGKIMNRISKMQSMHNLFESLAK